MDKLKSDFASAYGLSRSELDVLLEIIHCISPHSQTQEEIQNMSDKCFQLQLQAAEVRYARMKAALSASLMEQTRLKEELITLKSNGMIDELKLHSSPDLNLALFDALSELKQAREEVARLKGMNSGLRTGIQLQCPAPLTYTLSSNADAELSTAREQITFLNLELNRMSDKMFDYDERIREYEDVVSLITGERVMADSDEFNVHPRFHPVVTCSNDGCKAYARRLREGMRRAVAEV